jgi:hypothetical protein
MYSQEGLLTVVNHLSFLLYKIHSGDNQALNNSRAANEYAILILKDSGVNDEWIDDAYRFYEGGEAHD